MTTRVNYKIMQGLKCIDEGKNEPCYSSMTYGKVPKTATSIILYHKYIDTIYDKKDIEKWVMYVNDWGFPAKVVKGKVYNINDNEYFVIKLPLKISRNKKKIEVYPTKTKFTSALMLLRLLMENYIFNIPKKFFELVNDLPHVDSFELMQVAHWRCSGNTNHTVRCSATMKPSTRDEMRKVFEKCKYSIHEASYPSITDAWYNLTHPLQLNPTREGYIKYKNSVFNIYVVGQNDYYTRWIKIPGLDNKIVGNMADADLVLFTGGEDVSPDLYGEPKHPYTSCNPDRDTYEVAEFEKASALGKKMLGICRGSQFLCVMSGGKLVQHQENPEYIHDVKLDNGKVIKITSTHHQAMYPFNLSFYRYRIIGYTNNLSIIHQDGQGKELSPVKECEIVYFRDTDCLGIQGHPEIEEYMNKYPEYVQELNNILYNFLKNYYA